MKKRNVLYQIATLLLILAATISARDHKVDDTDLPQLSGDSTIIEYLILSTNCWSVGIWGEPRSGLGGRSDDGNMFWFLDSVPVMYDNGVIISYAENPEETYFSIFDGSDSNARFIMLDALAVADYPSFEYARGLWATPDTAIIGSIQYFLPKHQDSCFLIERFTITNNTDESITINVGEGVDWDIPDGNLGFDNESGVDADREMIWISGPQGVSPYEDYYGGVAFTRPISGALILENDIWTYPNSGYVPADIGYLLATHTGFISLDSLEDLSVVYVVEQNLTINPGKCKAFCKVKASSLTGLSDLQVLIDKGLAWVADRALGDYRCELCSVAGEADGSGGVDIDDVIYLINYIFAGGPEPIPMLCCGDAEGSLTVDIDDVVFLINYIFSGGAPPGPAPCNPPW